MLGELVFKCGLCCDLEGVFLYLFYRRVFLGCRGLSNGFSCVRESYRRVGNLFLVYDDYFRFISFIVESLE